MYDSMLCVFRVPSVSDAGEAEAGLCALDWYKAIIEHTTPDMVCQKGR